MCASNNVFEFKKIHDPVHGTIGLSELEVKILDTKVFQRLRNIKQLGLTNYVFPGAEYNRFSHSLGVCHLCGKLYDAKSQFKEGNEREKQKIRLAGLLHDIGHYPFSHTTEEAIELYVDEEKASLIKSNSSEEKEEFAQTIPLEYLNHESIGRLILQEDVQIKQILKEYGYEPRDIYALFTRDGETPEKNISNIISSDLDADRLDYLLRSSYHIGLPYGTNDLEYILCQIKVDNEDKVCISPKALRTVDHFLLCRYFDYSQVVYHKTVVGFEEILKKIVMYLIKQHEIDYSEDDIVTKIKNGEWNEFDDNFIIQLIRRYYKSPETPKRIKLLAKSILERIPPKEIVKIEYIKINDAPNKKQFDREKVAFNSIKNKISTEFKIDPDNIFLWNIKGFGITKIGKDIDVSDELQSQEHRDKIDQIARIHNRATKKSETIITRDDSLMSILSNYGLYSMRLFILFDTDEFENRNKLNEYTDKIRIYVNECHPEIDWK